MEHTDEENGDRMRVFEDRVEFIREDGEREVYREGTQTEEARSRYNRIKSELDDGYLRRKIERVTDPDTEVDISPEEGYAEILDEIVDSITSEKGRALAGLLCGQLTIKSIAPEQSVRLHKGSRSSAHFSWKQGLSMRTIDSNFIAPALRDNDLLRVNRDGVMMTRSLAENYPYSKYYKANIRGPQDEWATLLDAIEGSDAPDPEELLEYFLVALDNRGERAQEAYDRVLEFAEEATTGQLGVSEALDIISSHLNRSSHGARIFEVALHSLFQVREDNGGVPDGYKLKALTQMRSADKKHGNIADIEIVAKGAERQKIREAWDAKYGIRDLETEIKEVGEKLENHPETERVGIITSERPDRNYKSLITELEAEHDVKFLLMGFEEFVNLQFKQHGADLSAAQWVTAYTETLCQKRRDRAPIDEPTRQWVESLEESLKIHS